MKHTKDLPMDRTERRRLAFYHLFEQVMRGGRPVPPSLPKLPRDKSQHAFSRHHGVMVDRFGNDTPTPEQMARYDPVKIETKVDDENETSYAYKVTQGSALSRLMKRGTITELQCRAGEAYFATWYLSAIDQKTTAGYGQSVGKGEATYGMPPTEKTAYHRQKLREAQAAMGPVTTWAVDKVVIQDWSLRDVGWHSRARKGSYRQSIRDGKASVIAGLDALVDFYQIS